MKAIWISGSTSSSCPRLSLQGLSVEGNGVFLGPENFLCTCVCRDAEAIWGSASMAVSINCENKLLPGRIAKACYFITAGTSSDSNAGQDTWNTLITAIQSHSCKKIARVSRDKWKKGLDNPGLPISEVIKLILHCFRFIPACKIGTNISSRLWEVFTTYKCQLVLTEEKAKLNYIFSKNFY